jgi:6-hydroxycyclohex-1-ene-1-carbonyl-CoA dehydrogenase
MPEYLAYPALAPNEGFEPRHRPLPEPGPGEVLIQVAGCGVCHTDLSYYEGHVAPVSEFPLVLGHEISGRVVAAGEGAEAWIQTAVVVPAVIPCGACPACQRGRPTACPRGWMPGNHGDGGFATHIVVPARGLCPVPEERLGELSLAELGAVADAVTTPLQAIRRAGLEDGDLAIVVGVGGVGGFCVQIAAALGATVFALDVDADKLARYAEHGAAATFDVRDTQPRDLRREIRGRAKEMGLPGAGWRIFECSGTPAGQSSAFQLLNRGGSLSVVGFTPAKVEVRMSNVMALDAELYGNWGCDPALYSEALDLVLDGRVALRPFVETQPLASIADQFQRVHRGEATRRVVLVPEEDPS